MLKWLKSLKWWESDIYKWCYETLKKIMKDEEVKNTNLTYLDLFENLWKKATYNQRLEFLLLTRLAAERPMEEIKEIAEQELIFQYLPTSELTRSDSIEKLLSPK